MTTITARHFTGPRPRVGLTPTIKAWHFTGTTLRDGRPIPPVGEWLRHEGEIEPCKSGLHASERAFDALQYAPGPTLHRVEMRTDLVSEGGDKIVGRERRILWSVDATAMLREFARAQALSVIQLWDAPDVVRHYLETGDETLRAAARAPARAAARAPAWDAARAAAWDAARAAAWDAARAAAWDAARAAAWDAARASAWDAAWDAARAAAWYAAASDFEVRCLALAPEVAQ